MNAELKTTSARRLVSAVLCVSLACLTCGNVAWSEPSGPAAVERPATRANEPEPSPHILAAWRPTPQFLESVADTMEVDFPADSTLDSSHLYRDIGVFAIVSAFVGYFIVKVFIEKDTDEVPPKKNGKDIPIY